jgi:hypothetical protein
MSKHVRVCSIDGCDRKHEARGWCVNHYAIWKRHGDPLGGGTTPGDPEKFVEKALSYDLDDCLIWPFYRNSYGYAGWGKRKKSETKLVSRYICEVVNGKPDDSSLVSRHTCGNGHLGCVSPKHLIWGTKKQNAEDAILHGRIARGQNSATAKLRNHDIAVILGLFGMTNHPSIGKVAKLFNVNTSTISYIKTRKNWAWV